jgi:single-strand DNA-binding protein
VCWNNQAEILCKYCGKGSRIGVSGELQTRSWTDNEGNKRSVVEVVADEVSFCGSKQEGATSAASAVNDAPEVPAYDDDYVPF